MVEHTSSINIGNFDNQQIMTVNQRDDIQDQPGQYLDIPNYSYHITNPKNREIRNRENKMRNHSGYPMSPIQVILLRLLWI